MEKSNFVYLFIYSCKVLLIIALSPRVLYHIAYSRQECHNSKTGIFQLLD